MKTINTIRAIKLTDWAQRVPTGYILHSGWSLLNTANGMLISINGVSPYIPRGGKSACETIAKSGMFSEVLHVKKVSTL